LVQEHEKIKASPAQSYWRTHNLQQITEEVREMAGDPSLNPGEKKFLALYQKAQAILWKGMTEAEKDHWAEAAMAEHTAEATPEDKMK
jgi:hypothetical protein